MHVVFFDAGGALHQIVQRHGHRLAVQISERSAEKKVVPDIGKLPDDRHHDDRARTGQQDAPEDAEKARLEIENYKEHLEQLVDERTKELEESQGSILPKFKSIFLKMMGRLHSLIGPILFQTLLNSNRIQ